MSRAGSPPWRRTPFTNDIIIRYRTGDADHAVAEERVHLAILSVGLSAREGGGLGRNG